MRGKPRLIRCVGIADRITPADAGKTQAEIDKHQARQDHPRGCGENKSSAAWILGRLGSPPRMRGKQRKRMHRKRRLRITPADAGKTSLDSAF